MLTWRRHLAGFRKDNLVMMSFSPKFSLQGGTSQFLKFKASVFVVLWAKNGRQAELSLFIIHPSLVCSEDQDHVLHGLG